jgi:hypothetical protein
MNEEQAITATIAKYPTARKTPVENVAYWGAEKRANRINLNADKAAYNWKGETWKAIQHVLKIQGKI